MLCLFRLRLAPSCESYYSNTTRTYLIQLRPRLKRAFSTKQKPQASQPKTEAYKNHWKQNTPIENTANKLKYILKEKSEKISVQVPNSQSLRYTMTNVGTSRPSHKIKPHTRVNPQKRAIHHRLGPHLPHHNTTAFFNKPHHRLGPHPPQPQYHCIPPQATHYRLGPHPPPPQYHHIP